MRTSDSGTIGPQFPSDEGGVKMMRDILDIYSSLSHGSEGQVLNLILQLGEQVDVGLSWYIF